MGLLKEFFYPVNKSNCLLGDTELKVTPLLTPAEHRMGFMFQEKPKDHEGLLFVYPKEVNHGFWMKNVDFDLDLLLFDKNKNLLEIIELLANDETIKQPSCSYGYALEVPRGFCSKNNINPGASITFKL